MNQENIDRPFASMPEVSGTYYILNRVNNRIYVGQTGNLRSRFMVHRSALNIGNHHNQSLQNDWNIFGESSFEFGILAKGSDRYEGTFVQAFRSDNPRHGYNLNYFNKIPRPETTRREQIDALAQYWGIAGRRYVHQVIERCIDLAYEQLIANRSNPA